MLERRNIWTEFNNELGFSTASIQYIELTQRIAVKEHEIDLNGSEIIDTAKQYGLSVSELPNNIKLRIASNYIIQIHSCVEQFLNNYQNMVGSSVSNMTYSADKDENKLKWIMKNALPEQNAQDKEWYDICNYYRLTRNMIIHKGRTSDEYRTAFTRIKKIAFEKLNAINDLEHLCFDDQVVFARTARKLMQRIYINGIINWQTILKYEQDSIEKIKLRYQTDSNMQKAHIENYLKRFYPLPESGLPIGL